MAAITVSSIADATADGLGIDGGTVDNGEVVKLLNARGFNEHGHNRSTV